MFITIPFAQIDAENPNIQKKLSNTQLEIYFKNIVVCFASLRAFNKTLKLQLVTNKQLREPYSLILEKLDVEIKYIPFNFEPPEILGKRFKGCFYILDTINDMSESTLFIDPDVICMNPIDLQDLEAKASERSIGVLNLNFSENQNVNGISHAQAIEIYNSLTGQNSKLSFHIGGEAFFLPIEMKNDFLIPLLNYWNKSFMSDISKILPTEEHIFSVLVNSYNTFELNDMILRIWTSKSYRATEGGRFTTMLPLWHLPAEKTRGFLKIYEKLIDQNGEVDLTIFSDQRLVVKFLHLDKLWWRNLLSKIRLLLKIIIRQS